jgi:hypothetical protein
VVAHAEQENVYNIFNAAGQQVYKANEGNVSLKCCFCWSKSSQKEFQYINYTATYVTRRFSYALFIIILTRESGVIKQTSRKRKNMNMSYWNTETKALLVAYDVQSSHV